MDKMRDEKITDRIQLVHYEAAKLNLVDPSCVHEALLICEARASPPMQLPPRCSEHPCSRLQSYFQRHLQRTFSELREHNW